MNGVELINLIPFNIFFIFIKDGTESKAYIKTKYLPKGILNYALYSVVSIEWRDIGQKPHIYIHLSNTKIKEVKNVTYSELSKINFILPNDVTIEYENSEEEIVNSIKFENRVVKIS